MPSFSLALRIPRGFLVTWGTRSPQVLKAIAEEKSPRAQRADVPVGKSAVVTAWWAAILEIK